MMPLVGVPETIRCGMAPYRDVFCRAEGFEHISRYVTGLLLSPNKTLQGIYDMQVWEPGAPHSRRAMQEAVCEAGGDAEALRPRHRAVIARAHRGGGREVRATQVVLCAGAPDTEEIGREMEEKVEQARRESAAPIIWIAQIVPKEEIIPLYTHASVFVCPSVYEPFGLINLEAMACEAPVVASAVGGIREVVVDGTTGLLVPPARPVDLAAAIRSLLDEPTRAQAMGRAGRRRVEERFSWARVAERTEGVYAEAIAEFARAEAERA